MFGHNRKIGSLVLAGTLLAMGGLPGCVARVERRPVEPSIGSAGSAWEAALPAPYVTQSLGSYDARQFAEFSRNDAALAPRTPQRPRATTQWPEDPRPSLSRARRLQLETRPDQILYFERERSGEVWHDRSSSWSWWW